MLEGIRLLALDGHIAYREKYVNISDSQECTIAHGLQLVHSTSRILNAFWDHYSPYLGDIAFFGSCTLRSKANAKQRVSGISSIDVKVDEAISLRLKSIDH